MTRMRMTRRVFVSALGGLGAAAMTVCAVPTVNLAAAQRIGLTLPQSVLRGATETLR